MSGYNVPYDVNFPGNVHAAFKKFIDENPHIIKCSDSFNVGTTEETSSRWWLSTIGYAFTNIDDNSRQITYYKKCPSPSVIPETPTKNMTSSGGKRRTLHRHRDKNKKKTRRKHVK